MRHILNVTGNDMHKSHISASSEYVGMFLMLIVIFLIYVPSIDNYFTSDDFGVLAFARENGLSLRSFFQPANEHLLPFYRAFIAMEFKLFGVNASAYYLVNIILHLTNTFLSILLFSKLVSDKYFGLLAGMLFGVSASHWRVTMWITTQGQLLGTAWFLIGTLFFLKYLDSKRFSFLFISSFSHLLMLFSFTMGVEIPILYCLFFFLFRNVKGQWRQNLLKGLGITTLFVINLFLYFALRNEFVPESGSVVETIGGVQGLFSNMPKALWFLIGGIYNGYLYSFTGTYLMPSTCGIWKPFFIGGVLIIMLSLTDLSAQGLKRHSRMVLWLLCCLLLIYFLPTLFRIPWGFEWFVTRARYRYLPCIPAAAIAALFFLHLRPLQNPSRLKALSLPILAVLLFVITANIYELRRRETFVDYQSHQFKLIVKTFLEDVKVLLMNNDKIGIFNHPFSDRKSIYAGWNVKPSHICRIYLSGEDLAHLKFISYEKPIDNYCLVYRVEEGSGHVMLWITVLQGRIEIQKDGMFFLPLNTRLQLPPFLFKKGKYEIILLTKGTEVEGENALFRIYLGESNLVGQYYSEKTYQERKITVSIEKKQKETISVEFVNHVVVKKADQTFDRNAYIKSIRIKKIE